MPVSHHEVVSHSARDISICRHVERKDLPSRLDFAEREEPSVVLRHKCKLVNIIPAAVVSDTSSL